MLNNVVTVQNNAAPLLQRCVVLKHRCCKSSRVTVTLRLFLDCKTVRIFAYSSTSEQSNKRCEARAARARLLRRALPISLLILRKKSTVLQSRLFSGFPGLFLKVLVEYDTTRVVLKKHSIGCLSCVFPCS